MSSDSNVCGAYTPPHMEIELNHDNLLKMYHVSGGHNSSGTRYVYAVNGLRIDDDKTAAPPCKVRTTSRWLKGGCDGSGPVVGNTTLAAFQKLIGDKKESKNPFIVDLYFYSSKHLKCDTLDISKKGFEITSADGSACYKNGKTILRRYILIFYALETHTASFFQFTLTTCKCSIW